MQILVELSVINFQAHVVYRYIYNLIIYIYHMLVISIHFITGLGTNTYGKSN